MGEPKAVSTSGQRPNITDFFEFKDEGTLHDKLTGGRVFLLSLRGRTAFYGELESTFFESAPVVLERMGYSYGTIIGKAAKRLQLDAANTFNALFELAAAAGWGRMSLSGGDLSQGKGILRIRSCVFCESLMQKKATTYHFVPGVVKGVSDEVTGRSHSALEQRRICKGDASCEIEVRMTALRFLDCGGCRLWRPSRISSVMVD